MKHIKKFEDVNPKKQPLEKPTGILCRTCAAYSQCKLDKKGHAVKCRNFWGHRPTADFIK